MLKNRWKNNRPKIELFFQVVLLICFLKPTESFLAWHRSCFIRNVNLHLNQLKAIEKMVNARMGRYGNFLLMMMVAAVLALLIIPLPAWFLDLLLAMNIIGAVTLLLVSISIRDSLQLASFPTLLLMATLFRLGLNIASTRLILTKGFAGDIILTFGEFAAGGNLLVGMVMFLILTIIQFIVIAKGSERVAEVAARFTLDALPGKQMSIDADLRAGLLSQEEAKTQRNMLHRESKMYGAMDGAMKFVKGDAIAGIIIIGINIFGGILIGVLQQGMTLVQALNTFAILTIGDGLVSQIPSLLVSITAGFVVTRVADAKSEQSLGSDIGIQLTSEPKALLSSSVLAFFIGFIPGFPTGLFVMISLFLAFIGLSMIHAVKKQLLTPAPVHDYVVEETNQHDGLGLTLPLALEVGPELYRIFQTDTRWVQFFGTLYPKLQKHLSYQMGLVYPDLKLVINESLSQTFKYRIRIHEIPVDHGILSPHQCAYLGEQSAVAKLQIETPQNSGETVHGTKVMMWDVQKQEELNRKGLNTFGPEEMMLRHLGKTLLKHSADFLDIQEVRHLLNRVENSYPELVREVVPKMMSIQKMTEIIKRLAEERIPIKDLRLILQTLACCQPEQKDPVTLTEQVRIGLKRIITFMHAKEGNRLALFTLHPDIEEEISKSIQKNGSECFLALPPDRVQAITEAFQQSLWNNQWHSRDCVVLTNLEIRRYTRKIIEQELPDLSVLSFQELDPKIIIHQVGEVALQS